MSMTPSWHWPPMVLTSLWTARRSATSLTSATTPKKQLRGYQTRWDGWNKVEMASENTRLGWSVSLLCFSLRLFTTAQRTTAQLSWCRSVPGESTRILIPISPSAEVSYPADVGPRLETELTSAIQSELCPWGNWVLGPKVNLCKSVRSLHIYHLFCGDEGAENSWCDVNVEHLYIQRFAH